MSDVITVPQVQPVQPVLRFLRVVPGVILLAGIGYAGKLLEQNVGAYAKAHHWTFPNIEYVLWAIVLGLVISNAVGVPEIFRAGVATYEFWLKVGIVLLGSRFLLGDILKLGGISLVLVAVEITGSIAFMTFLGRLFRLKPKLTSLLAVGSAAGALYSDAASKLAVLVKSTRNAMIGFVVLAYAIYWASRGQAQSVGNKAAFLWQKFPKFVLGFLLISVLATYHFFNKDQVGALANLSRWAFLLTFAGVGLRTNFREMRKQGLRPFAVGAIGEVVIAAFTLGLVAGAGKLFGW